MSGSEAVLGADGTVEKVALNGYSAGEVNALGSQTLENPSISISGGVTTMEFEKLLKESGEIEITTDTPMTFLVAYGTSTGLSYHADKGAYEIDLVTCDSATSLAPSVAPVPSAAPEEISCESDDPAYTFKYTFSDLGETFSFYWKVTTDKLNAKITSDAGGWGKHL